MKILGLNIYHGDSSAAIVVDGKLIAAIEEERFRRIKHWTGFPSEAIKWCLSYSGLRPQDLDYIAISRKPVARLHKKILLTLLRRPSALFLQNRVKNYAGIMGIKDRLAKAYDIGPEDIKAGVINVEHHRAHIASAFFVAPFNEAAVVSVDGFGDFVSTMTGFGKDNKIEIFDFVEFPHSLGIFYTAMTQFLGFPAYGDEYKVMGLSAYGKPSYLDEMREIVRLKKGGLFELNTSYFTHVTIGVDMTWLNGEPKVGRLFNHNLIKLLGNPRQDNEKINDRHFDLSSSVQAVYEEAFFHILNSLYKKIKTPNIALAGGCIQNSLANGKIYSKTPFKNIYIPPAAHDAGGAIGAAYYVWNQHLGRGRSFVMNSPFWGPGLDKDEVKNILRQNNIKYEELNESYLLKRVASDLAKEKVVGWFNGRTEWGPRALGNRSILADPRSGEMKSILNAKIKKREDFRPFAPSILEEKVEEWFEQSEPVPFMEKVYAVKEAKRSIIPAVTHIDGTGRVQTVSYNLNPRYYGLIKAFEALTHVPILLNTSFNENEPIVNTAQEALDCYLRTDMDVLILGDVYIAKKI